nr:SDR family NAD(P)-dependent oxidoreductase [Rathayibacter tanaceti]
MTRPLALVTGASSGIGAALAADLAADGHDLVLVARRQERLLELQERFAALGATTEILAEDLSDPAGLERVVARAGAGDVDLLVSNAGVSAYGPFAELDPEALRRAWTLNADATPLLTRAVLPGMLERSRGGIITVASTLAFSAGIATAPRAEGCRSGPFTWRPRRASWRSPACSPASSRAPGCARRSSAPAWSRRSGTAGPPSCLRR